MRVLEVATALLVMCIGSMGSLDVGAQTTQYRWVDKDGKPSFGDNPPLDARNVQPVGVSVPVVSGALDGLPYELRRVAERFPVTLYSADKCTACDRGRELLRLRGVPFAERTIVTPADQQAFEKLGMGDRVPVLQVGGQRSIGFETGSWQSLLDLAGYPRDSRMPSTFKFPPSQPMTNASEKTANDKPDNSGASPSSGTSSSGNTPSVLR